MYGKGVKPRGKTKLQQLLDEREMSQGELAMRSGVSRERICRLANGSRPKVHRTVVVALAWGLDVDPYALRELCDDVPFGPRHRMDVLPLTASAIPEMA